MADASAATCRENAAAWRAKAEETALPRLRLSYLASAEAWTARADSLDRTADLRAARIAAA